MPCTTITPPLDAKWVVTLTRYLNSWKMSLNVGYQQVVYHNLLDKLPWEYMVCKFNFFDIGSSLLCYYFLGALSLVN